MATAGQVILTLKKEQVPAPPVRVRHPAQRTQYHVLFFDSFVYLHISNFIYNSVNSFVLYNSRIVQCADVPMMGRSRMLMNHGIRKNYTL